MLVAVVVMCALVLIALAVAAPVIATQLRRDKEVESEHRAEQYVRAIRLYYRKVGGYPPSIDALKNTNNIRFLRQEYADPLTGKSDWRIIHYGEQKTEIHVFFGQELGALGAGAGGSGGGLGSAAGMSSGVGSPIGASGATGSSTIGATSALTGGFLDATTATGASGSTGASGTLGSAGALASSGGTGSTGGAIVGVGPAKTGTSILTPNKQTTYETWEFWYDPAIEQLYKKGQMNAGMGTGSLNSSPIGSSGATGSTGSAFGGSGSGNSGSGFGNSSGFGSSGSSFGNSGSSFGNSGFGSSGSGSNNPGTQTPTTPSSPQ